jgi:hypothetical protein
MASSKTPVKRSAERPPPPAVPRLQINGVPIDDVSLYKIDHLTAESLQGPKEPTCRLGRLLLERRSFMLKSRLSHPEYTMNIFYIIGVIVVVLFVAGFFGLHA